MKKVEKKVKKAVKKDKSGYDFSLEAEVKEAEAEAKAADKVCLKRIADDGFFISIYS